jgi:hypothetical protein
VSSVEAESVPPFEFWAGGGIRSNLQLYGCKNKIVGIYWSPSFGWFNKKGIQKLPLYLFIRISNSGCT